MGKIVITSSVSRTFQPDTANFNIHMCKVADTSRELMTFNKASIDALIAKMNELSIEEDNLRETSFRITVNREYVDGESRENGYKLDSRYTLSNYIDYEVIDSIREALTVLGLEFSVSYSLEDEGVIRDDLLREAVKKSHQKAKVIAAAENMSVGEMLEVQYNGGGMAQPMMLRASATHAGDAVPTDIEISESVEVQWELLSE